ncbi:antigen peptide transporter 2-like isoform X1 [Rhinatrema bivittatum]|uniref:antigen peptide transporter 2-like isoform X1 n=2 Tax=Rhinatrema bivittatum TaxID=194408 RepID=UPI00112CC98A|nr:antigen peptide transporter 2-like isoform X1 [Rhinatrema bivittatum]
MRPDSFLVMTKMKMMKAAPLLLALFLLDATLTSLLTWLCLRFYPFSLLSATWALALLRLALLCGAARTLPPALGRPPPRRVFLHLLVLTLASPACDTARFLLLREPVDLRSGVACALLPLHAACLLAGLFWELLVPWRPGKDSGGAGTEGNGRRKAREALGRLWVYSKPDKVPLSGAFIFLTLAVICEMFIPYYTGKVIDILGSRYREAKFYTAISLMALFSMASSLSAGCRGGLFTLTIVRLTQRLRVLLFRAVVQQEIGFFESTKTGEITSRLATDTALMSRSIALNVNVFLRSLMKAVGIYCFMLNLSWQLTLFTLIDTPITALIQEIYNRYYESVVKEVQDSIARSSHLAGETVHAIRTVRSFGTEQEEAERYGARLLETHRLKTRRDMIRALYLLAHRLTKLAVQVIMLYCGQHLIRTGQMSSGNLVSFIIYQEESGRYIQSLVHMYGDMIHSMGAAEKVFQYLDRKSTVPTEGDLKPKDFKGHVHFQNVSFSYPTRPDVSVLKDVSFELRPGKVTALVGPSGGGKTTCISLLERFYEPQAGEILLDGRPLRDYDHKYLHTKISLVGQEPVLFARSVAENVAFGLRDYSMEDVETAAQEAHADPFIQQMERKYRTDVGEAGGTLAGGQKQRIAIARALVRRPQLLVLDEASSCLDIESEHKVQETLSRMRGQTVLVVAHRLKTVEDADKIVVIEEGRVVEEGNHRQLMEREGAYHRLVQRLFTQNGDVN